MKKIILADGAARVSDSLFASASLTGPQALAAAFLFALQIYADFSGYTDIARGSARFLGIRLTENFHAPYLARGLRDFWRRWHITLTRWFTDYVYIPLGGNKRGALLTARNTLIVFALSGLWHGRGLHFLIWGLAHGLLILLEDRLPRRPGRALTFLTVSLLWILFRAPTLSDAARIYASLPFGWQSLRSLPAWCLANPFLTIRLLLAPALLFLTRKEPKQAQNEPSLATLCLGYALFLAILFSLLTNLQGGSSQAFLYFAF